MCFCALLQPSSLCALCVSVPFWQSVCPVCFSAVLTVYVPCVFQCTSDSLPICVTCAFQCPSDSLPICVTCVFQCPSDSLSLCVPCVFQCPLTVFLFVCPVCFSALLTVFLFVCPVCFSALLTVFLFVARAFISGAFQGAYIYTPEVSYVCMHITGKPVWVVFVVSIIQQTLTWTTRSLRCIFDFFAGI